MSNLIMIKYQLPEERLGIEQNTINHRDENVFTFTVYDFNPTMIITFLHPQFFWTSLGLSLKQISRIP